MRTYFLCHLYYFISFLCFHTKLEPNKGSAAVQWLPSGGHTLTKIIHSKIQVSFYLDVSFVRFYLCMYLLNSFIILSHIRFKLVIIFVIFPRLSFLLCLSMWVLFFEITMYMCLPGKHFGSTTVDLNAL